MQLSGKGESLWLATTPTTTYPSLTPNLHVDVAILGGGITGLMTAYQLKQQGKTVAVIEARHLATGTTGHTTAHCSIAHELIYEHLATSFSKEAAGLYAKANQTGIELIGEIAAKERIACDYQQTDEFIYIPQGMEVQPLQSEYEATQHIGLCTTYLEKPNFPVPAEAAIQYPHQAQFHPRKFLLGLANKIPGEGSYIFEQTRALDVKEAEPMVIETDQGRLTATDVVIATLYPFLDRGLYFARLTPYSSYVLAVTIKGEFPLAMFDSTESHSHYLRRQRLHDRYVVLVGGEGHQTGEVSNTHKRYRQLEDYARQYLDVNDVVYRWSTHDTYPPDKVPYIGKFLPTSDHLYVATGFQGWGMAHGAVASLLLTDLIVGQPNSWTDLYDPGRFKPQAGAKEMLTQNLHVGKMFLNSKISSKPSVNPESLQPREWKIIEADQQKVAVYKDEQGQIHAVKAVCQHMGCNVSFNTAEKTWDCPCHGSRYKVDGDVLYGPTVKPLPQIDLSDESES